MVSSNAWFSVLPVCSKNSRLAPGTATICSTASTWSPASALPPLLCLPGDINGVSGLRYATCLFSSSIRLPPTCSFPSTNMHGLSLRLLPSFQNTTGCCIQEERFQKLSRRAACTKFQSTELHGGKWVCQWRRKLPLVHERTHHPQSILWEEYIAAVVPLEEPEQWFPHWVGIECVFDSELRFEVHGLTWFRS